jgi:hypothetical protein
VIVRRRDARLVVDVGEHLELQVRVLVENLQAAFDIVAAIFLDEVLVAQELLEVGADLLAAAGAGIALQGIAAVGDELIELVSHVVLPGEKACYAEHIFAQNLARRQPSVEYPSCAVRRVGIFVLRARDSRMRSAID